MKSTSAINKTMTSVQDREIILTRVFDAPREDVFIAWTDPQQVPYWWGPQGFTLTTHHMDVRPGGTWSYIMHGPDGVDYDNQIVYQDVVHPERLAYAHGDLQGEHFQVTVTFKELGGQTELTMRTQFKSAEELEFVVKEYGAIEGGVSTLERLADHLIAQ